MDIRINLRNGSYMPHFERLPDEVQRSLIAYYERLAANRSFAPRDRADALERAENLKERYQQASVGVV